MSKVIIRRILLAVCGIILGLNLYMANANSLVGNKLPMPFGYGAAVVLSGSMEPTFSTGDLIIVKEKPTYAENDIVVFQEGNMLVVHRIVSMEDGMVTTKGDANDIADKPIEMSAIKGEVLVAIPGIGTLVGFIKTPVGTMMILAAAIALIEIPRRNEKRKDDEERDKIIEEIKRLKDEQ